MEQYIPRINFEQNAGVVKLLDEINQKSIFKLCNDIEICLDYYKYDKIEIQIDSPGGEISYLDFYLERLSIWKNKVQISTLVLSKASSAAAVISALGDIGNRFCYENSMMLFHEAWLEKRSINKTSLKNLSKELEAIDNRILNIIVGSAIECYKYRNENDYGLQEYDLYDFSDKTLEELYNKLQHEIKKVQSIKNLKNIKSNKKLSNLFDIYSKLFALNTFIDPITAYNFYLIDEIKKY